jgi:hypothetical protein
MLHFKIEQVALCPTNPAKARELLEDLGLTTWFKDNVHASGEVYGIPGENHALLQFNYEATAGVEIGKVSADAKPLELEVLHYTDGRNWMARQPNTVSHLGMHVTGAELEEFRRYFFGKGIGIAQEVVTQGHTILGVDLKFIERLEYPVEYGPVGEGSAPDTPVQEELDKRGRRIGNRRRAK